MSERQLVWHFVAGDRSLFKNGKHHGDEKKIHAGQTLHVEPPLEMCKRGLHGSIRPLDALEYVPGRTRGSVIVCRCEVWGEIEERSDKLCAEYRKVLWWADCSTALHEFACDEAERALALIDKPDPRSLRAIEVKRKWLKGEATDEELSAAWSAAWSAARSAAAWSAARSAAESAAESAGKSAGKSAWSAAESAAWSAWSAAESAAWSAAKSAWSARSATRSAWSAARSATRSAWSAARSAARSATESAARSATESAWSAWLAARLAWSAAQNECLTTKLLALNTDKKEFDRGTDDADEK